jgi:ATP-dependent exoDNAse (exonuclease V) alpha subunit
MLAWSITIHKSQGLGFDYAKIQISGARDFAAGLTYVALSRLRRWGGRVLSQAVSAARMLSLTAGLERRQADERRRYGRTL